MTIYAMFYIFNHDFHEHKDEFCRLPIYLLRNQSSIQEEFYQFNEYFYHFIIFMLIFQDLHFQVSVYYLRLVLVSQQLKLNTFCLVQFGLGQTKCHLIQFGFVQTKLNAIQISLVWPTPNQMPFSLGQFGFVQT